MRQTRIQLRVGALLGGSLFLLVFGLILGQWAAMLEETYSNSDYFEGLQMVATTAAGSVIAAAITMLFVTFALREVPITKADDSQ